MKSKIAVGQCYEKNDIIYEVIGKGRHFKLDGTFDSKAWWRVREVITKIIYQVSANELLSCRRPFNTEG
jgi:hypothetical protein